MPNIGYEQIAGSPVKSANLDTKKQTTKPTIPIAIGSPYSTLLAVTKTVGIHFLTV